MSDPTTNPVLVVQLSLGESSYYKSFQVKDSVAAGEAVDAITAFAVKQLKGIEKASPIPANDVP